MGDTGLEPLELTPHPPDSEWCPAIHGGHHSARTTHRLARAKGPDQHDAFTEKKWRAVAMADEMVSRVRTWSVAG
jgi:hypothetical protein